MASFRQDVVLHSTCFCQYRHLTTMPQPKHFLIAGATGRQGGAVVNSLLSNPEFGLEAKNIWAITRDVSGAGAQRLLSTWPGINIVTGDLNSPQVLFDQLGSHILQPLQIRTIIPLINKIEHRMQILNHPHHHT